MTRPKRIVVNISIIITAVLGVSGWAIRSGARYVSDSFVHQDVYTAHVAREDYIHLRDSLVTAARATRADSELSQLYRACQRRGECP